MTTGPTRSANGEPTPERSFAAELARELVLVVLERSKALTAELSRLAAELEGVDVSGSEPAREPAELERHLERVGAITRRSGWWLAVLSSALGARGLGARRDRRGLEGALAWALEAECPAHADETPTEPDLPDLAPVAGDGWQAPFAWLAVLRVAVRDARGGVVCAAERFADGSHALRVDGGRPRAEEVRALRAWLAREVPGADLRQWSRAPGRSSPNGLELVLPAAWIAAEQSEDG